jgi:hypothetical protein
MDSYRRRITNLLLLPLAAAVVFFEQVLIRWLNVVMAALARWPPVKRLEARLVRLPPYAALLVFGAPSILILPVKLSAVWFVVHGQYSLAVSVVVAAKLVATAMVGRLYWLLRPNLRTIPWFARLDTWFFDWRDRTYAFVRSLPAWQTAAALVRRLRARFAKLVSALSAR